jgi:hypothetical protein
MLEHFWLFVSVLQAQCSRRHRPVEVVHGDGDDIPSPVVPGGGDDSPSPVAPVEVVPGDGDDSPSPVVPGDGDDSPSDVVLGDFCFSPVLMTSPAVHVEVVPGDGDGNPSTTDLDVHDWPEWVKYVDFDMVDDPLTLFTENGKRRHKFPGFDVVTKQLLKLCGSLRRCFCIYADALLRTRPTRPPEQETIPASQPQCTRADAIPRTRLTGRPEECSQLCIWCCQLFQKNSYGIVYVALVYFANLYICLYL